jgi:hypothetical protein
MKAKYTTPERNTYLSSRKMYHNIPTSSVNSVSTKSTHKTSSAFSNISRNLTKTNFEQGPKETDKQETVPIGAFLSLLNLL